MFFLPDKKIRRRLMNELYRAPVSTTRPLLDESDSKLRVKIPDNLNAIDPLIHQSKHNLHRFQTKNLNSKLLIAELWFRWGLNVIEM
jgi:hypothetical protein